MLRHHPSGAGTAVTSPTIRKRILKLMERVGRMPQASVTSPTIRKRILKRRGANTAMEWDRCYIAYDPQEDTETR